MPAEEKFLAFFKKTHEEIEIIQKAHGFTGKYRTLSESFVKYNEYLTPNLNALGEEAKLLIGAKYPLKLKSLAEITAKSPGHAQSYMQLFNFNPHDKPMGNSSPMVNILRCIYDLSFRYKDHELLDKCNNLIIAYFKFFMSQELSCNDVISNLCFFFHIHQSEQISESFILSICRGLTMFKFGDALTEPELNTLQEFIYVCPEPKIINESMRTFYKEFFARVNNPKLDILDTAAWVIKAICDIHPFADGNGRVSRTLACNLIRGKIDVEFTQDEIKAFGDDEDYNKATSRMNCMPHDKAIAQIRAWLQSAILKKNPKADFGLSQSKLPIEVISAMLFSDPALVGGVFDSDDKLIDSQLKFRYLYNVSANPSQVVSTQRDEKFPNSFLIGPLEVRPSIFKW